MEKEFSLRPAQGCYEKYKHSDWWLAVSCEQFSNKIIHLAVERWCRIETHNSVKKYHRSTAPAHQPSVRSYAGSPWMAAPFVPYTGEAEIVGVAEGLETLYCNVVPDVIGRNDKDPGKNE
uniref:Uncharacterized protein n=1 Tax=Vespula pensylvanica TaxID=30213 RepID=A0A834U919_VESPE|nr:hypothetical protein H0235_008394 [Vespula pensylvanica]